jgi:hypothetical protein
MKHPPNTIEAFSDEDTSSSRKAKELHDPNTALSLVLAHYLPE